MVFTLVYIIARGIAFSNKNLDKGKKKLLDRENEANNVRRQDISQLDYVNIDFKRLPLDASADSDFLQCCSSLKALEGKKILDLSAYTNTDLKLMYGPANLEELSQCDANYTSLIRLLDSMGNKLLEEGSLSPATTFLEYAIEIGSDLSTTFLGLADIYVETKEKQKLKGLVKKAGKLKSLLAPTIKFKLENKLNKM